MRRTWLAAFALLLSSTTLRAQDMPLSQILIDGEGWKKVNNPGKLPQPFPEEFAGTRNAGGQRATAYHGSSDGGTLFVGYGNDRAVWAFKMDKGQTPTAGAP